MFALWVVAGVSREEIDGSLLSLIQFVDALGDLEEAGIDVKALLAETGQLNEAASSPVNKRGAHGKPCAPRRFAA